MIKVPKIKKDDIYRVKFCGKNDDFYDLRYFPNNDKMIGRYVHKKSHVFLMVNGFLGKKFYKQKKGFLIQYKGKMELD